MITRVLLIPRIAIFSALIYVLSLGTTFLPNFNFIFFIIFISGYMWGVLPGMMVGALGMALWTSFNPFGPAIFPIMLAQIIGASMSGMVGGFFNKGDLLKNKNIIKLIISAVICSILFYLPVNFVDAWVFQPFKERFIVGAFWSLISIGANSIIFPLLFNALKPFLEKERMKK